MGSSSSAATDAGFRGRLVIVSGSNPRYGDIAKRLSEAKGMAAVVFLQKPFSIAELRPLPVEKGSSSVLVVEDRPGNVQLT